MNLKQVVILISTFFVFQLSFGQERELSGTVTDNGGVPLPAVNIVIKGSGGGTSTDFDGNYTLMVSPGDVLVFSSIGFQEQSITVGDQPTLDVTMEEGQALDEVIVIGYGTQKRSDNTAAISSVKADDLAKRAVSNPVNAMQGKVPGLTVTNTGGSPGEQADISLRGIGTFGNHQPLFIIDGVPGDPFYLSNSDIQSMDVLKDGAAAAIYGSRAANGVVIITTKDGKKGEPVIDANMYYSWVSPTKKYSLLDANGYKMVHEMMYDNAGIAEADWPAYIRKPSDINTDWQDLIHQQGISQNYDVAVRGGGEYVDYSISGNMVKDKGTFIGSGFEKKSIHAKTGIKKGILDIKFNTSYAESRKEDYKFELREAYFQSPLLPVFDESEEFGFAMMKDGLPPVGNPVGDDFYVEGFNKTQYYVGNVTFKLDLFENFDYTVNLGYRNRNEFDKNNHPPYWTRFNDPPNLYPYVYNQRLNWKEKTMEHILHYNFSLGDHNFNLMAGTTATSQTSSWLNADVEGKTTERTVEGGNIIGVEVPAGFPNPNFSTIDAGRGGTYSAGGSEYTYNRTSLFGRLSYEYLSKYLFQFSVRRDGSSKFGDKNRYGVFPSVALGWNLAKEDFMDNVDWLNDFKLRASYGKLGNEETLSYYEHQTLIQISNTWAGGYVQGSGASPWPGSIARDLENRELKWETATSYNFGIDFGFFQNQLTGAINYFQNNTSDLLITRELPPSAGFNNPILNVGKIENQGVELELTYRESATRLQYDITGILTTTKNKVTSLANEGQILYGTGLKYGSDHIPTQTRVGQEVGSFYLYQADGIFQNQQEVDQWNAAHNNIQPNARPGDIRFLDVNGDGVLDEDDKVYSGSGFPTLEFGFNVDLTYDQFDFSMFWQGVAGNKIYNGNGFELMGMDAGRSFLAKATDAWTPQNTNTSVPRAVLGDPNGNNRASTRFLEKGDYLRLKTIQLGYTLPKDISQRLNLVRTRIYVSAENLVTLTNYSGLDPEIGKTNVLDTGVDRMLYPQTKKVLIGLQLSL